MKKKISINIIIADYINCLTNAVNSISMEKVDILATSLLEAWQRGSQIYLCGNGGSAANANHLANDFIYGAGIRNGIGLRTESLSANSAVLTCLANDIGYNHIYSDQIKVKGNPNDILIALSGSGNSINIINALETANIMGMNTFAILGFNGGRCKELAKCAIHFDVNDMQVAEDLQLIVGHMCMKWLAQHNLSES